MNPKDLFWLLLVTNFKMAWIKIKGEAVELIFLLKYGSWQQSGYKETEISVPTVGLHVQ